jgi:hypothetical protein
MRNKKTSTKAEILAPLLFGGLLISLLFLMNYLKITHVGIELVLTPFIVTTLLAYGESLVIFLLLLPVGAFLKKISKSN